MSIEILSDLVRSRKPLKGESQSGSPSSLGVLAPFQDGGSRRSALLSWSLLFPVVALAAGWPSPLGAQLDSVVVADAWARVDSLAASVVRESGLPGLALAITDERALVHEAYLGEADIKTGRPVTAATLFQIGSITKSFTALSLMRLADRGIFDPDRPVSEYLPWFSVRSEFGPITGHHLLTHSAGIPSNRDDIPSSPYQAFALREQRTAWAPGERFLYSNVGYQVLSVLLERLDGRPYERILAESIFGPAQMETARPVITLESRQAQAVGYIPPFDDRPHHPSRGLIEAPHFPYDVGDGSIQATARDLAAYARLILNRGVGPGGRVVTEDAFRRFSTGYVQDGTARYGYGIRVQEEDGRTLLAHSGGMVGFGAYLVADTAAGIGVVTLVNGPSSGSRVARYALAVALALRAGAEIPDPPDRPGGSRAGPITDYQGLFLSPSGDSIRFARRDSSLAVLLPTRAVSLEPRGDDAFYSADPELDRYMFIFERNDSGEVATVSHGPAWFFNHAYGGPTRFEVPASWREVAGRYRSWSPWLPYFEVIARAGQLILVSGEGGESSSGETPLVQESPGVFRIGEEPTPERLSFHDVVEGRALTADWSGHVFFRVNR
jgi:D-alanyl-D-alanine carboxypeptidase